MDETWILGLTVAGLLVMVYLILTPARDQYEKDLKQLQVDADVLETHIRHFLMAWWKNAGQSDPAYRWHLKVSMVSGQVCAYVWRHTRRNAGEPLMVVVHSKYWSKFYGQDLDRDSRIMDEAINFVEVAFTKKPIPITGTPRDL